MITPTPVTSLHEFVRRYDVNNRELVDLVISRRSRLSDQELHDMMVAFGEGYGPSPQADAANLMLEADTNLRLAIKVRDTLMPNGHLTASAKEAQASLTAVDRLIESARKNREALHTLSTSMAIEEAVMDVFQEFGLKEEFLAALRTRLEKIK